MYCKTKISTITLILILTISAILFALPTTTAQETRVTYPYIGAVPNPVGREQEVLLHVGIYQRLNSAQMGWEGLSITIERPDGETDVISDIRTDSTGGTGKVYIPDMVGKYYLKTHFPEQVTTETKMAPGTSIGTVMLASTSDVLELEVLEERVPDYPGHSLPTEYWTRPIDAQLREWYKISGNWLEIDMFLAPVVPGNDDAPESPHILWATPLAQGGLAGGTTTGEWSFNHGDAYEGKWSSHIVINGILIYAERTNTRPLEYIALNIRTGEEMWTKTLLDNQTLAFGQTMVWPGYNLHAVYPYIWTQTGGGYGPSPPPISWNAFDPYTGDWEFTVTNIPAGTTVFDERGWVYRVNLNLGTGQGYVWSLTDLIVPFGEDSPAAGSWPPGGSFYGGRYQTYDAAAMTGDELSEDAQRAYVTEFEFPAGLPGSVRAIRLGDKAFGMDMSQTEVATWAISLESGNEGDLLFDETWIAPTEWADGDLTVTFATVSLDEGVAVMWTQETMEYYGFSTENGSKLWGPTEGEHYLNYFASADPRVIYDGRLYVSGVSGIVYCYDVHTGDTEWTYEAYDPYNEFLFSSDWWQILLFFTDGKVYLTHVEHSAIEPMPRGAPFLCLNTTTGDVIWRADGLFRGSTWGGRAVIGDSVMVAFDTYDNRLYAVGKGPSQISVSVAPKTIPNGQSIIVEGTVMDVSPGINDLALQMRFPNGIPAVSDASMNDWMLYVWKNFERPADVEGVEVFVKILDPNGDYYSAEVTTDENGRFSHMWNPAVVGEYQVTAIFEGSESYYPSQETTTFGVDTAPTDPSYQGPTADEIAQKTISQMPAYPDVPSASEVAQETVSQMPEYQTAEIPDIPAYLTIDLVLLVLVIIGIIIGLYAIIKKK
jgi:outer membrane protein assembly factor BamB